MEHDRAAPMHLPHHLPHPPSNPSPPARSTVGPSSGPGARAVGPAVSPSLRPTRLVRAADAGAYEIKYVLTEALAAEVEARFSAVLAVDPHADPALGGAYAITSLYCETPSWDVYHREGRHRTRKYRVRRYGASGGPVFLERKTVVERRVRKRRSAVEEAEVARAIAACSGETEWFARQVAARGLSPACRVRYLRRAMFGVGPDGPMRVTFDRSIRGALTRGWAFDAGEERALLDGVVVCEFKFAGAMPSAMKAVAAALTLTPSAVSKYRACIGAFAATLGLPTRGGGADA